MQVQAVRRGWQNFVDAGPIASLALVGVIATQLGTYFGYVFPAFGLPVLPWPLYNGILGTTFADGANGLVNLDATFVASFATSGEAFFVGNAAPLRERHRVRDPVRDPVP